MSDNDSDTFEEGFKPGQTPKLEKKKGSAKGAPRRRKGGKRKGGGPRCIHCQAGLKTGMVFCSKCGGKQEETETRAEEGKQEEQRRGEEDNESSSEQDSLEQDMKPLRGSATPLKAPAPSVVDAEPDEMEVIEEIIEEEEEIVEMPVEEEEEIIEVVEEEIVEEIIEEHVMDSAEEATPRSARLDLIDEDGDEEEEDSQGGSPKLRHMGSQGLPRASDRTQEATGDSLSTDNAATGQQSSEMAEMARFFEKHRLTRERLEGSASMLLDKLKMVATRPPAPKPMERGNTDAIDEEEWEEYNVKDPLFPFLALSQEARNLYLPHAINVLKEPLDPLTFYREYVSANVPVVIRNAQTKWRASKELWTNDYLRQAMGDRQVDIECTPKGRGDYVRKGKFVVPETRKMSFSDFIDSTEGKLPKKGNWYLSRQNGNFESEFEPLHKDVEEPIDWAVEAFGCVPDVTNIWIGDSKAVSSCHKDHYENIFMVITGEKHFTLLPPTDYPFLYEKWYPPAKFRQDPDRKWRVYDSNGDKVPWVSVDPDAPDLTEFPLFSHAHPYKVTVKAGECLYLPSLWYHQVSQTADPDTGSCIAINQWFDMRYDSRWNYYNFMANVTKLLGVTDHGSRK